MAGLEHLDLPFYNKKLERNKRPSPIKNNVRSKEEKTNFSQKQRAEIEQIEASYNQSKLKYQEYIDPSLIFKLEFEQGYSENTVIDFLAGMDIDLLSVSPDKKGYWVVFSNDLELTKYKEKLSKYASEECKYDFFNLVSKLDDISPEEKLDKNIVLENLNENEYYFDVEIWRMDDLKVQKAINGISEFLKSKQSQVCDKFITENLCLLRIKTRKDILLELLEFREISFISLPPKIYLEYSDLAPDISDLNIEELDEASGEVAGIAIFDTGVISNHPLFSKTKVIGDSVSIKTLNSEKIKEDNVFDEVGHGTQVAGIAAFGDIKQCLLKKEFKTEVQLFSVKIMYGEKDEFSGQLISKYDETELLEHQLYRAAEYVIKNYPNCRIINLSLGNADKKMYKNKRQENLSLLIDEISKKLNLIFVVSTGNLTKQEIFDYGYPDTYPKYLLDEDNENVKIIEPASAALAITVGAIAHDYSDQNERFKGDKYFSPAKTHYPSPFTRVGLGYKGMIKPELVEEGGNLIINSNKREDQLNSGIPTLARIEKPGDKLFTVVQGSSFSTPKVSNYIARIINKYPRSTNNLIKALLLSSAEIPNDKPEPLHEIDMKNSNETILADLFKVYGYGKPNIENACYSDDSRVVLKTENRIKPDSVQVYSINLPDDFINVQGRKEIEFCLVYDPPIRKNRIDYLGCSMEFHLFKNAETEDIIEGYGQITITGDKKPEGFVPPSLKNKEVKDIKPGINFRNRGVHQKGILVYPGKPSIDTTKPLTLVVICQNNWINLEREPDYIQDYAIIAKIKHYGKDIKLYSKIKLANTIRIRAKQ